MVCPRGGSGVPDWSGFSAGCGYEAEGLEIPEPLAKRVLDQARRQRRRFSPAPDLDQGEDLRLCPGGEQDQQGGAAPPATWPPGLQTQGPRTSSDLVRQRLMVAVCNSSPGIDMSAEVSCGLGLPEGAGKVDTTEADGRPHGFEAFGGEPIEATVLDPCDEAVAAELGDQA